MQEGEMKGNKGIIRSFLMSLLILTMTVFTGAAHLYAEPDEALIAAAKKEGRLSFYSAMNVTEALVLARAFEAKYPGIKVDVTRLHSQGILSRVMNEYRAQRHIFDVVNVNIQIMTTFKEEGVMGRYVSPECKV